MGLGKFSMPSVILLWIVEQPIVSFFVMRFMHACRKDTASLAAAYSLLGREEEARASAVKCMELAPHTSVSFLSKISREKDEVFLEKVLDALRKAGFPE